jgi:hypothetical protein
MYVADPDDRAWVRSHAGDIELQFDQCQCRPKPFGASRRPAQQADTTSRALATWNSVFDLVEVSVHRNQDGAG